MGLLGLLGSCAALMWLHTAVDAVEEIITLSSGGGAVRCAAVAPDGALVASAVQEGIILWNLTSLSSDCIYRSELQGHSAVVTTLAFSHSGQWLVTGSADMTIRLWDPITGVSRPPFVGHKGPVLGAVFTPNDEAVVSCSSDGTLIRWNASSGAMDKMYEGHQGAVLAVAVSPDGEWVASAGVDNTTRLWALAAGTLNLTLVADAPALAVLFSSDGQLVTGGGSSVRWWDVGTGQPGSVLQLGKRSVGALALAPTFPYLAVGTVEGPVLIYNITTGNLTFTLSGHTAAVTSVTYAGAGSLVLSASADGTIRLWHAAAFDCQVSDWGGWSSCDCVDARQQCSREVLLYAANGGLACPALQDQRPCQCGLASGVLVAIILGSMGALAALLIALFFLHWRWDSQTVTYGPPSHNKSGGHLGMPDASSKYAENRHRSIISRVSNGVTNAIAIDVECAPTGPDGHPKEAGGSEGASDGPLLAAADEPFPKIAKGPLVQLADLDNPQVQRTTPRCATAASVAIAEDVFSDEDVPSAPPPPPNPLGGDRRGSLAPANSWIAPASQMRQDSVHRPNRLPPISPREPSVRMPGGYA